MTFSLTKTTSESPISDQIDDAADGSDIGDSGTNVNLWPQLSMRFGSAARYRGEGSGGSQFGFFPGYLKK